MYYPQYCPPTPSLFHLTIRIKKKISACKASCKSILELWLVLHSRDSIRDCHPVSSVCDKEFSQEMALTQSPSHFICKRETKIALIVSGAFHKHSSKPSWVRMYCLEQLLLDDLFYIVLHENTAAAASGLSTRTMQAPVLGLVEFFWGMSAMGRK